MTTSTRRKAPPWWQKEVHSAPPHSPGDGPAAPNAPARAPAREVNGPTAQFQGDCAPECAVTDGDESGYDWAAVWAEWKPRLQRLVGDFTPPDIVHNDQPSLAKRWAYADRGEWTTKDGAPRTAGRAYNLAVAPVIGVLMYVIWILERPSRHAMAWVLLILLAQFPPLSWLI